MKAMVVGVLGVLGLGALIAMKKTKNSDSDPVTIPDGSNIDDAPGLARSMGLIRELDSTIQPLAVQLLRAAHAAGIDLVVTQGYRSSAEQAALYAKGRTTPGPIVTKSPPGSSWHEFRRAFDVAILVYGHPTFPESGPWDEIGAMGKALGLQWGGDWPTDATHVTDRPHFQLTGGMTLAEARAGKVSRA